MLQAYWIWAYIILQIDNNVMKYNVRLILCDNSKSQVFYIKYSDLPIDIDIYHDIYTDLYAVY